MDNSILFDEASSNGVMDLEPITLPAAPEPPRRQPVPVIAAVVPIAAGVVLWLVTGSVFALCFAALGPLMIGASLLDGLRTRRRDRRAAAEQEASQWRRAERELRRRHERERAELRRIHPDAAGCLEERPLRDLEPVDASTGVVVGTGDRRSAVRVSGGDGDRSRAFRERGGTLADAPIVVPMGRGLCIRGPRPIALAIARAILVQLCLRHAPGQLALVGGDVAALGLGDLPHARRPRRGAWRLAIDLGEGAPAEVSAQLRVCEAGGEVPEGVTTVIDCGEPLRAQVRSASGVHDVAVEGLSRPQAEAIAARSAQDEADVAVLPDAVSLDELGPASGEAALGAMIGRGEGTDLFVDLVEDGPHAVVTGMTGSGKSELLVTWITSLAQQHSPAEVIFVLADFKGGTAFDPLRTLPHVAAVITDLDDEEARRGVASLTAELRRREAVLAAAGARSVAEPRVDMPRLVIVVDEFAALLQEHPALGAVFTDVAARGRALGMHLILGTQRATGVIRDALAANCPLRVSLRVSEAADSRLVIGTDEAAELPGDAASRGLAFVRRPKDATPCLIRVALTSAADLRRIGTLWPDAPTPVTPWLPPLPRRLLLEELPGQTDAIVLGRADEPERQRQPLVTLRPGIDRGIAIIGGSGSGRSSALRMLAAQYLESTRLPADPEQAWDLVDELHQPGAQAPRLLLCDDLDQLAAALPADYAIAFLERLEQVIRAGAARECTVVVTAGRVSGPLARVVEALPMRMLLRTSTKLEHLAAGGESDGFRRDRPPGRGHLEGREVQIAWTDAPPRNPAPVAPPVVWSPASALVGVVSPATARVADVLRIEHPECDVVSLGDRIPDASLSASPAVLVGDAESWQRQWALWQRIRSEGEMLVLAECPAELRSLAGVRELPPYARPNAGRAWSVHSGRPPRRVTIAIRDTRQR